MSYRAVLRSYPQEEAPAWLLRNAGYRLLLEPSQDPYEFLVSGNTLLVQGTSATHQVDVLSEVAITPAFSLPTRMFLEAKFSREKCRLHGAGNAHGVVHDVDDKLVNGNGSRNDIVAA